MLPTVIDDKLTSIFRAVFELDAGSDPAGVVQGGSPKWDSIAHVLLVAAVENEFGISIDTTEALSITSYETARELVAEKLTV